MELSSEKEGARFSNEKGGGGEEGDQEGFKKKGSRGFIEKNKLQWVLKRRGEMEGRVREEGGFKKQMERREEGGEEVITQKTWRGWRGSQKKEEGCSKKWMVFTRRRERGEVFKKWRG